MRHCVIIILLNLSIFIHASGPTARVIGGSNAADGLYPYQVLLKNQSIFICGGSIIGKRWILTAAHCVKNISPKDLTVTVGTNQQNGVNGTVYQVEHFIAHENYEERLEWFGPINDIALIYLTENVTYSERVKEINLPKDDSDTYENTLVTLIGWGISQSGKASSDDLQHVQLKVLDPQTCNKTWIEDVEEEIITSKICTSSEDGLGSCIGDSGGPIVLNETQIGIVSYGWPCATGLPDIYTRVSSYLDWIHNKTAVKIVINSTDKSRNNRRIDKLEIIF